MAFDQVPIRVSTATHRRVTAVKQLMEAAEQRQVTYSECVDLLVRHWEATGRLVAPARDTA